MRYNSLLLALPAILLFFAACINPKRPAPDQHCRSDSECPLGWYCNPETLMCVEGAEVWQHSLPDVYQADTGVDIQETQASGCLEGKECDDYDPCTYGDRCTNGVCKGTAYSCNSSKPCVIGQCLGNGDCRYTVKHGYCLIDSQCVKAGTVSPDNQCMACVPEVTRYAFSNDDGLKCDDHDPDTTGDHCLAGRCVGTKEAK